MWLADASVERMASRLIKPNTLYHMAARGFLLSLSGATALDSISSSHLLASIVASFFLLFVSTSRVIGFYPDGCSAGRGNVIFARESISHQWARLYREWKIFLSSCGHVLLFLNSKHERSTDT